MPIDYSSVRYLLSKKPVDDRALNQTLLSELRSRIAGRGDGSRLDVLEIGAGVGTMVSRLSEWNVVGNANYTLIDQDQPSLKAAEAHLREWADHADLVAPGKLSLRAKAHELSVRFVHGNALEHVTLPEHRQRYDLVTANAVLDLMEVRPALERIWQALRPGGLFWFTINFDGESIFLPEAPLDERVTHLYHRTMDERVIDGVPSGDSKTGRHLLELIPKTGATLLSAGSSDWVVFPSAGAYRNDEAYFLHHIVDTIWTALRASPELDTAELEAWVQRRHGQIDAAQLIYIAHQLDVLGHVPG